MRSAHCCKDLLAIPDIEALLTLREQARQEHSTLPEGEE